MVSFYIASLAKRAEYMEMLCRGTIVEDEDEDMPSSHTGPLAGGPPSSHAGGGQSSAGGVDVHSFYTAGASSAQASHSTDIVSQPSSHAGTTILMSVADIARIPKSERMGRARANAWLKTFRDSATDPWWDLSHHDTMNWRSYLANHKDAHAIIGSGVVAFGFLNLEDIRDPSVHEERARSDYCVLRSDGTAGRLHPHKGGAPAEAKPIVGRLADWLPGTYLPSSHAGTVPEAAVITLEICNAIPQIDRMPHRVAGDWLRQSTTASPMSFEDPPRPVGRDFKWWLFLANLHHKGLVMEDGAQGITEMVVERLEAPTELRELFEGHRLVAVRTNGTRVHIWPGHGPELRRTKILAMGEPVA